MLSFSTCWNNSRHTDGEAMIDEILALGIDTIELSHGMTVAKLPGIRKAYAAGKFRCSGVHNYFPSPTEVIIDAPDAYEFTSHRPSERKRAREMTLRTLELAAEFSARYVVLHMGSVPLMPHKKWTGQLTRMLADGEEGSGEFTTLKIKTVKKREKTGPRYLARAIEALEDLSAKAAEYRIPLAIESRSKYEDVPTEREMIALQTHFKDNPWIGYWHDFGHVQLKHNLGLLDHDHWLGQMKGHILGTHVHDVQWPKRDHRVPFTGTIDFKNLLRHFDPRLPHVWELSPGRRTEQILQSLEVWKHLFPETLA